MMFRSHWLRHIVGVSFALLGCLGVMSLLLAMNAREERKKYRKTTSAQSFQYQPQKRPPVKRRVRPQPRRQAQPKPAPRTPLPRLSSAISNVDFGIPGTASTGLEQMSDQLLGQGADAKNLVMTEKSVDRPPRAVHQVAPQYPARARAQSITGKVLLAVLIGTQGEVEEVEVISADPPGVFEQVALQAIRQWRFQPAMYKGAPVKVKAQQLLRFRLE